MYDQIQVRRTFHTVRQFISWHGQKQLVLKPPFQRNFVWKPKAKSYLVDSVLRGFPLPILILRDRPGLGLDPIVEVVDGQQRLTTLISFVAPERFTPDKQFTISKTHSEELAGKGFGDLDASLQQRILDYELSVHILPSSVDDQQVLRIFARLNSTGESLKEQELRNAEYQGEFKTQMFELSLAHLRTWRTFRMFSEDDIARMREVEFTSDLVLRVLYGTTATTQATLNREYRRFDDSFPDGPLVKDRFEHCISEIERHLGEQVAKSEFRKIPWFFTLFGQVHDRSYGVDRESNTPILSRRRAESLSPEFWNSVASLSDALRPGGAIEPEVVKALSGRTTNAKTRRDRETLFNKFVKE